MKLFFTFLFSNLLLLSAVYSEVLQDKTRCDCYFTYSGSRLVEIEKHIRRYEQFAKTNFRFDPPYIRYSWQTPFKEEYNALMSKMPRSDMLRYPNVRAQLFIYDQFITLHDKFWTEVCLDRWNDPNYAWALSKQRREEAK